MRELAERTRSGPGRLLITVYAVFALAATARSAVLPLLGLWWLRATRQNPE